MALGWKPAVLIATFFVALDTVVAQEFNIPGTDKTFPCNSDSNKFKCPASDDKLVVDCLEECDGLPNADVDRKVCFKRTIFSDRFFWNDVVAAVVWFFAAGLAMAAGVGGGGIYVPLGILLLRFANKPATGLSQASIFGASLAGLFINSQNRHPKADRPVIDLDMALVLAPMEMAGAMLGVVVQKILPEWIIYLLFAGILGTTAVKTYQKGFKTYAKES